MKKISVIILVFGTIIVWAGVLGKNNQANVTQENRDIASVNASVSNNGAKILKVQHVDENGRLFEDYEYYTYYYFNNNILTKVENVYVFNTHELAQNWYEQNEDDKENIRISNNIITKETRNINTYETYENVFNKIRKDVSTVGYTIEE